MYIFMYPSVVARKIKQKSIYKTQWQQALNLMYPSMAPSIKHQSIYTFKHREIHISIYKLNGKNTYKDTDKLKYI